MRSEFLFVFTLAVCPALLPMSALATDIYGYVDNNGVAHYSNVPDSSRYKLVLRDPASYKVKSDSRNRLRGIPGESPLMDDGQPSNMPEGLAPIVPAPIAFDPQRPFGEIIKREALSNSLDPFLVVAVIAVESNHNPGARSPKGAAGLMQLMPDTAKRYGIADPYHAESNIRAGTRYLRDLMALFNGDVKLVLAAYNAGENAVIRYGNRVPPYPETQDYVPKVLKIYDALRRPTV